MILSFLLEKSIGLDDLLVFESLALLEIKEHVHKD